MKKYLLPAILFLAMFFRLYGIDWDSGFHLHPDERMLIMVAERLRFPYQLNPEFFAYGSFPIYLLKFASWLTNSDSYNGMLYTGRVISALFDLGTVMLVYLVGKELAGKAKKLAILPYLAAFLYAISVLPIQSAHFFISDIPLTFFITLTLYLLIKLLERTGSFLGLLLGLGLSIGLALASKVPAVFLVFPVLATIIFRYFKFRNLRLEFKYLFIIANLSFVIFVLVMPYALLDFVEFKSQLLAQSVMRKDPFIFPYTLQYVGTRTYLYFLDNLVRWGLGWPLGILAVAGTIYAALTVLKARPLIILFSFFIPFFLFMGSSAVKFMRYLLPLYPLLALFMALLILKSLPLMKLKIRPLILAVLLVIVSIWPIAFISIYSRPHPRIAASEWIFSDIPAGSMLAVEHWDDRLPLPIQDSSRYNFEELALYDPDTPEKWELINEKLEKTDYIIIASNRLYTPLMRLTDCNQLPKNRCYLLTAKYYEDLFAGKLGFKKVADFTNYPSLNFGFWSLKFPDQSADESFTVYDHPQVIIYEKLVN